jgi:hypothetical protein
VTFGLGHVHNVAHGGNGPATSIHAYSPALLAMTYYQVTGYGLIATETALADATASAAELRSGARCRPGAGHR